MDGDHLLRATSDEIRATRCCSACVYARKAIELYGQFAWLNFPEERDERLQEIEAERSNTEMDSRRDAETQG